MNFRTWSSGLVAVFLALGLPGPHVAVAGPADLPHLARHTSISGSTTAYTDVYLPRSIAPVREMTYGVKGAGRLTGFVMVKQSRDAVKDRPALVALRSGRCVEAACAGSPQPMMLMLAYNLEDRKLPPGRYRLYLVADGAPVHVSFDIPALTGRTHLRPRKQAAAQLETIESTSPTPHVLAGGVETDLRGDGISAVFAWAHGGAGVAGVVGGCFYREDPPPAPAAFVPGCPQAAGEPRSYGPNAPPAREGAVYQGVDMRLDRALGAYYATAGVPEGLGAIAFWLKV